MFQRLQSILARARQPKQVALRVAITDNSATLYGANQQVWTFRWEEVTRVDTYKCDLFAVDMICLDFFVASRQLTYSVDDEMLGFDILCEQIRRFFPSIEAGWWSQVALPPFATQHSILYEVSTASRPVKQPSKSCKSRLNSSHAISADAAAGG